MKKFKIESKFKPSGDPAPKQALHPRASLPAGRQARGMWSEVLI